jgi:uncharacterized protein YxjI
MKYKIRQKIFSLTDSFEIEDERGDIAYTAKGKVFSISSSQTMFDPSGAEVLKIKRKYLSIRPACRLVNNDGSEWLIKKHFWPFWKTRFSITTPQGMLEMTGNILQHEYEMRQNGQLIAGVSKKWFSFSDTYGVDIYVPEITAQLLAAVIVIDRIQHSDSNSSFISSD